MKTKRKSDPGLLSNMGSREIFISDILEKERDRPLKWRVRKKLRTKREGRVERNKIVERNQIVERNSKKKSHLRKRGNYDRNLWYLNKEQIYLRKNVKRKLGSYDLGLLRGEVSRRTEDLRLRVLSHSITPYTIRKKGVCWSI